MEHSDDTDSIAGDARSVFRLIYRSRPRIAPEAREIELDDIFRAARRRNVSVGVSGALLVWRDAFVQVLEGEEGAVRSLYARIRTDPRHEDVVLLGTDTVPERVFARWSMARVEDDDGADVPAHRDRLPGTHPEPVPPLVDAEQVMMLDVMRDYARPDVLPQ